MDFFNQIQKWLEFHHILAGTLHSTTNGGPKVIKGDPLLSRGVGH